MLSSTINLEVMSRAATQRNKAFRGWHGIQRRSRTSRSFEIIDNITSTS